MSTVSRFCYKYITAFHIWTVVFETVDFLVAGTSDEGRLLLRGCLSYPRRCPPSQFKTRVVCPPVHVAPKELFTSTAAEDATRGRHMITLIADTGKYQKYKCEFSCNL